MSNISNIVLRAREDRDEIDTAIAEETPLTLMVKNEYTDTLSDVVINVADMDADILEAFKKMCDHYSWPFEATYPIIKVDLAAESRTVVLSRSYLRDKISTDDVTALDDGTPIAVRFEFAGFTENEVVQVTLPYNEDFSAEDKALLLDAGVSVLVSGKGFSFTNTRPCKIYFSKPDDVPGKYVIQYKALETIIPAT